MNEQTYIERFKEIEEIQQDIKNNKFNTEKILEALEDYKWLYEFKPFEGLANTQPISTEALYDACRAYSRWYTYTQCDIGLQKILFFDGWYRDLDECVNFRLPWMNNKKWGLGFDEDSWAKASEDMYYRELELDREKYNKGLDMNG